jgi:putative endonuclease
MAARSSSSRSRLAARTRPDEAVDAGKQQRLTRLALAYLKRHDLLECSARFDVVGVTWPAGARRPTIEHFRNAFEAVGRGQLFS